MAAELTIVKKDIEKEKMDVPAAKPVVAGSTVISYSDKAFLEKVRALKFTEDIDNNTLNDIKVKLTGLINFATIPGYCATFGSYNPSFLNPSLNVELVNAITGKEKVDVGLVKESFLELMDFILKQQIDDSFYVHNSLYYDRGSRGLYKLVQYALNYMIQYHWLKANDLSLPSDAQYKHLETTVQYLLNKCDSYPSSSSNSSNIYLIGNESQQSLLIEAYNRLCGTSKNSKCWVSELEYPSYTYTRSKSGGYTCSGGKIYLLRLAKEKYQKVQKSERDLALQIANAKAKSIPVPATAADVSLTQTHAAGMPNLSARPLMVSADGQAAANAAVTVLVAAAPSPKAATDVASITKL